MNKPFAKLKGNELLLFIRNSEKIVSWLKSRFVRTDILNSLCNALELWAAITPFMVITTITNIDLYKEQLKDWEKKLEDFYAAGKSTFMTKNPGNPGDDETFYLHVLRYYLPKIAQDTLDKHCLGLGIWIMQGFERRNKESKHTLKRFSSKKGNVLVPNLHRLWDIFMYKQNAM